MPELLLDRPYPKQVEFFQAKSKYIAYGGARGGGKSWAARVKAVLLALNYSGIQILLLRRTLTELRENHVIPLQKLLVGIAQYRDQTKEFLFPNGSRIVMGYCAAESDVLQYQGQAYDVIFMEEATQFTEFQFQTLTESNRPSGLCAAKFSPRMYFTCNPGGVGHGWVKRLFIDRTYRNLERPEDYTLIPAQVYDNKWLMENDPDYVRSLENLPDDRKRAMLYGDWDVFEGQYFSEFRRDIHVCEPFEIPSHWKWYFTMDYGLDMAAFYTVAVDEQRRAYVVQEYCQGKDNGKDPLIISDAAKKVQEMTAGKQMTAYLAPPDLWNSRQETGKSMAQIFAENGIVLTKTSNDRIDGWMAVKEWLKPVQDVDGTTTAALRIFSNCATLIKHIPMLQYDESRPSDVSDRPHDITHSPDALRGFCIYWTRAASPIAAPAPAYNFNFERPRPLLGGCGDKVRVI